MRTVSQAIVPAAMSQVGWRHMRTRLDMYIHVPALVKIDLEFRRNPTGIPVRTCPEFQVDSGWIPDGIRWNYCRHSAGIPAGIPAEFQSLPGGIPVKMQAGIPLELLPAFRWNSGGISVSSRWNSSENEGRNSAGIIAGIPLEFRRNFSLFQVEFQ